MSSKVGCYTGVAVALSLLVVGCVDGDDLDEANDTGEIDAAITGSGVYVPPQFFGQHWGSDAEWPSLSFGAGKVGPGIEWSSIEPSPGHWEFEALDGWRTAAKAPGHGQAMTFMYAAIHTPSWAGGTGHPSSDLYSVPKDGCPDAPLKGVKNTTDCSLKTYLRAVLDHVCLHGTAPNKTCDFQSWELHNEVNVSDGEWAGSYADLARMDADAIETIKGQCSSCMVFGSNVSAGGDGYHALGKTSAEWDTFLIAYLDAWPAGMAMPDGLSWHPYPAHDTMVNPPFPETYAGSDCSAKAPDKVCRQTVVAQIQRIREIADSFPGMRGKPLWATELGFTIKELTNASPTEQAELRAAYTARYLLALASGGVEREFWYAWDDVLWGTEHEAGAVTSVAVANQQVYEWLAGNTLGGACSHGGSGTVWTCSVTNKAGLIGRIVWNTAGSSTYTVPSTYRYWRDLTGPTKHEQMGTTHKIGIAPILFLNQ